MADAWAVLKIAMRAAVWRSSPDPRAVGLATLIAWCGIDLAANLLGQLIGAGGFVRFNLYGINATIATMAVSLAVAAFFVRPAMRTTALAALLALHAPIEFLFELLPRMATVFAGAAAADAWWNSTEVFIAAVAVYFAWYVGALLAILRSVAGDTEDVQLHRAIGLVVATLLATALVPQYPTFTGRDFENQTANWWEYFGGWQRESADESRSARRSVDVGRVELSQPVLLDAAVARLEPQRRGTTDIYAIGVAGWSKQNVFAKELEGAFRAISQSLPIANRIVRLVNHPDSLGTTPIASRQNFAAAVQSIARVMDKDEDVLLVILTSHGSREGLALQLNGVVYGELTPENVVTALDAHGIKNRLVIVSACYAGVFLKPLASDNAIVLTASDANSTSFGCSDEREWTYFGEAFFLRSLAPGTRLEDAFASAKQLVAQWEQRDGMSPSNPQAHFGPKLMARLAPLYVARHANAPLARDQGRLAHAPAPGRP